MSHGDALEIEPLAPTDVSQNVALSRSVGWKDVESEWRVVHEAAEVRGVRQQGRVVVQGALGDYRNSATLAKMVVAADLQRRGLGARLLDDFLARADGRGIPVGLCATDHGRPLYQSRGFAVSGELMILFGTPELETKVEGDVAPLVDVERAVAQDLRFLACDRSRMLRARCREASVKLELVSAAGYGLASSQGEHGLVGPVLAESEQGARQLLAAIFKVVSGPVRVDVPLQHVELRRWLVQLGLREMSVRVEMARGAERMPWQVPQRFALASQAWG